MYTRAFLLAAMAPLAMGFMGSPVVAPRNMRLQQTSRAAASVTGPTMELAIVTGASRGIGKQIALDLGKRGCNVIVNYAGSKDAAEAVAAEINGMGSGAKAMAIKADTSNKADVQAMFKEANAFIEGEQVSVLVNNAGITKDTLMLRMKEEDFMAVIDVNLKGVFLCTSEACKGMLKKRSGRIINISSVVGQIGNPGQANYAAAKGGVIGMMMSNAKEFAARGVKVNCVCPGFIESDMTAELNAEYMDEVKKMIPMGRLGKPSEISGMVSFLALDPAADYITGHCFNVDGGIAIGA